MIHTKRLQGMVAACGVCCVSSLALTWPGVGQARPNPYATRPCYWQVNGYYGAGMQVNTRLDTTTFEDGGPPDVTDIMDSSLNGVGNSVGLGGIWVQHIGNRGFFGGELEGSYGDDTSKNVYAMQDADAAISFVRSGSINLNTRFGTYLNDNKDVAIYGKIGFGSTLFRASANLTTDPKSMQRQRSAVWHGNLGFGLEKHMGRFVMGVDYEWKGASTGNVHLIDPDGPEYKLAFRPSSHILRLSFGTKF